MGTINIESQLDLYVKQSAPTTSFNSDTRLIVGYYDGTIDTLVGATSGICRTWLKFDISNVASTLGSTYYVTSVYLTVHSYFPHNYGYSSYIVEIARCTDNSWTSSTTWNSAPNGSVQSIVASPTLQGDFETQGATPSINISRALCDALADGNSSLSLRLKFDTESSSPDSAFVLLQDNDYVGGTYPPKITINYDYSLLMSLPCQDNAGTVTVDDVSTYNHDSALSSGVTSTYSSASGPGGSLTRSMDCTLLDADGAYIYNGTGVVISPNTGGCIQFWAKLDGSGDVDSVMGNYLDPGATRIWFDTGSINIIGEDIDSAYTIGIATGVTVTNWHHYAINITPGGNASLHVDGAYVGLLAGGVDDTIGAFDVKISGFGREFWIYDTMLGKLCGIKIYGGTRTTSQILADYAEGVPPNSFVRPATASRNRTYLRM